MAFRRLLLGEAALSAFISYQLRFDWRVAKLNPPEWIMLATIVLVLLKKVEKKCPRRIYISENEVMALQVI
jgi:hypothetical protein